MFLTLKEKWFNRHCKTWEWTCEAGGPGAWKHSKEIRKHGKHGKTQGGIWAKAAQHKIAVKDKEITLCLDAGSNMGKHQKILRKHWKHGKL